MTPCPRCGESNPDGARFCSACGAPLQPSRDRETRKTVTILFADVTGSTALGERVDPESFRRVMARYFEAARECLERHGGTVEKFIGDAVMAVFGVPATHEDDALRALRAAVDLRESLAVLNEELDREYGVSLQLRTGVNTGEVVTGTEERLATGDAVNVAARLEQAARPGEILIGEQTLRLARGAIEVEACSPLELKGKADPFTAYRLLRVVAGAPAFERRFDAPLVGRRRELTLLRSEFETAVSDRRCRVVTVFGPPGIGKSRLARELEAMLERDALVLTGRCLSYGDGITYWPLVEIFRHAGAEDELAQALSAGAPEEIFWSVRKALERRARERPLAVVVEDIHWAEPTLLDLLQHLVDWTRDAPIFLLCLARPELLDERPAWIGRQVRLEPLSAAQSDELIEELLGGGSLDDRGRRRIREAADGNPLFVEQLLALVAEGGDPAHVPPTIQALLAARLDALPDEERALLERASVVGLEFEWEALTALSPDRSRPPGAQLAALVRKEMLRPHEAIADLFRFRHILIRDAAYDGLPKELRVELHERFADWVENRSDELEEIVGYHVEQAYRWLVELGPVSDRGAALADRAADHLIASGARANARGDARAAANLFDRAAALLPADDPRRVRLLPMLGRALRDSAQMERVESVLAEAVERGQAAGAPSLVADANLALTDLRFQRATLDREDVVRHVESAIHVFEESRDEAGLARALSFAGKLRFWAGEAAAAIDDLERASEHARNAGDRAQEAESLEYECRAHVFGPTPVPEGLARMEEIRARADGNGRLQVSLLENRARLLAMQEQFELAREVIAQAGALAVDHGLDVLQARAASSAGYVELLAGDARAAEELARAACELLESAGELGYLASATPILIESLLGQGRDEEAWRLTERWRPERLTVPEDVDAQVGWRLVRARLLARRGDGDEAEDLAAQAMALVAPTDYLDLRAVALADLAAVVRSAGRPDEADAGIRAAIALYEQKGNVAAAGRLRGLTSGRSLED